MNGKFYTLAEARATLPQIRTYMHAIQQARREIMRLQPAALPAIEKAAQNGGCKEAGELFVHGSRIEHSVKGITALGVVLKDLDRGLVDFLCMRQGREIYLCWHYGEDDIAYWHELNGGFAGRRPIDEHVQ